MRVEIGTPVKANGRYARRPLAGIHRQAKCAAGGINCLCGKTGYCGCDHSGDFAGMLNRSLSHGIA